MKPFNFYDSVQVRYGDLDAQGHVNNARFSTYLEQARYDYLIILGLFSGDSFQEFPLILADIHIAFRSPIFITQKIRVGMRVVRIGNKSITAEFQIEEENTGQVMATAEAVMVMYDYQAGTSIRVPDEWREKIKTLEGSELS